MEADGSIKIDAKIDDSGIKSGVKNVNKGLGDITGGLKKTDTILGGLGSKFNVSKVAAAGFAGAAAMGVAKVISVMNDCAATYRVQEKAEKALSNAAKNNPYLNDEGVASLKNFASELQSNSTIGDEVSMQIMAQLANAGRTSEEIQNIMTAASDLSADGSMTIESAVVNLNKTFGGLSGELGEVIPELKNLTVEEMKSGAAVDIVAKKYQGLAKEMSKTRTGEIEQFNNSWGDLKENIGKGWDDALSPVRRALTGIITDINTAIAKQAELEDTREAYENGTANATQKQSVADQMKAERISVGKRMAELDELYQKAAESSKNTKKSFFGQFDQLYQNDIVNMEQWRNELEKLSARWIDLGESIQKIEKDAAEAKAQEDLTASKAAAEAAANAAEQAKKDKDKKATTYVEESNKALQAQIEKIELESKTKGEAVDQQAIYNAMLSSYISLLTESEGLVSESNKAAKNRIDTLQQQKEVVDQVAQAELEAAGASLERKDRLEEATELTENIYDTIAATPIELGSVDSIESQLAAIDELKNKVIDSYTKIAADREKITETANAKELAQYDVMLNERENLITEMTEKESALTKELEKEKVNEAVTKNLSEADIQKKHMEELKNLRDEINNSEVLSEKEKAEEIKRIDDELTQSKRENLAASMNAINEYAQQANQIAQDIARFANDMSKTETDTRLTELEVQKEQGLISADEYEEKKAEIEYEGAQKKYQIDMFAWTSSLLAATANIALGVTKAMELGVPAGIIAGALVAASGAMQIASITASKPKPPKKFASGGIVSGGVAGRDSVNAKLTPGEMVLNNGQQRALWETANGRKSANSTNIVIHNSAANIVSAKPNISKDQIEIMIDARVKASMSKGRYTDSFRQMQGGMNGTAYTI